MERNVTRHAPSGSAWAPASCRIRGYLPVFWQAAKSKRAILLRQRKKRKYRERRVFWGKPSWKFSHNLLFYEVLYSYEPNVPPFSERSPQLPEANTQKEQGRSFLFLFFAYNGYTVAGCAAGCSPLPGLFIRRIKWTGPLLLPMYGIMLAARG